jgi:hypothetical protein
MNRCAWCGEEFNVVTKLLAKLHGDEGVHPKCEEEFKNSRGMTEDKKEEEK